jgi:hypothetical protein
VQISYSQQLFIGKVDCRIVQINEQTKDLIHLIVTIAIGLIASFAEKTITIWIVIGILVIVAICATFIESTEVKDYNKRVVGKLDHENEVQAIKRKSRLKQVKVKESQKLKKLQEQEKQYDQPQTGTLKSINDLLHNNEKGRGNQ